MKDRIKYLLPASLILALAFGIYHVTRLGVTHPVSLSVASAPQVVLDPGHGGLDGGAVGVDGIVEKDINLAISQKVRDLLVLNGVDVVMTRSDDHSIHDDGISGVRKQKVSDMNNRLKMIQEHPGAIFVSIHQNQFTASQYSGAQVFYSPNNPSSQTMAAITQRRFKEMLQPENNREYKQAGKELFLLYNAECPAMLVECGFLSNAAEAHRLVNEEYQNQVAFVIFSSIMEFTHFSN